MQNMKNVKNMKSVTNRTGFRRGVPFVLATLLATSVLATPSPAPTTKEQKILELMELTGAGELGVQAARGLIATMRQTITGVPDEWWKSFEAQLDPEELVRLVVPVYDRHFDEQDIDGLLEFYRTPMGQKFVGALPQIMQESMAIGQQWGESLGQRILQKLKEDGYDV